jgi:transposase
MSPDRKLQILRALESVKPPKKEALARVDVPHATYYRWRRRFREQGIKGL